MNGIFNENMMALKALLEEVGMPHLYQKIVSSKGKKQLNDNLEYSIKAVGQKLDPEALKEIRRYILQIEDDDLRTQALKLIDALTQTTTKTYTTNNVLNRMTSAFLSKQKKYRPAMQNSERKSEPKPHPTFPFSSMTKRALEVK